MKVVRLKLLLVILKERFDGEEISWRAVVEYYHQQGGEKSKRDLRVNESKFDLVRRRGLAFPY